MKIKIGDFGLCAKLDDKYERRKSLLGTPNYLAPEVLDEEIYKGHSFEVDVWSLGCCVYFMLYGKLPFDSDDVTKTYEKIKYVNYSFPEEPKLSDEAKEFMQCCLKENPSKRATCLQLLNHAWLNGPGLIPE